jgi:hypothetical protein
MRAIRTLATLLLTATLVAACGSAAAPSPAEPSPTSGPSAAATRPATPTPRPTPTPPADVSAAFAATLGDPLFQARMTITGSISAAGITLPITGVVEVRPGASHSVMTIQAPSGPQTTETIEVGGQSYRREHGVWFEVTAIAPSSTARATTVAAPGPSFSGVTTNAGGFRDTGVETVAGRSLHHLALPAGTELPPTAFGLDDPAISNAEITVEFWADDAGTPAAMRLVLSWDQAVKDATISASMTLDCAITTVSVTIEAPTDVWLWRTSAAHKYTIAYPAEWEVEAGNAKTPDLYVGWDRSWYGVFRAKTEGWSLNRITSGLTGNLAKMTGLKGAKLDGNVTTRLDGVQARRVTFHGTYDGAKMWMVEVIAVKGAYATSISACFDHEPTKAELAQFQTFLDTFTFK